MAPSVTLNTTSDFDPAPAMTSKSNSMPRTLLLSPPSLSSHPEKLNNVLEAHDRNATDIQMLDRLSLSLVSLPDSTYDAIIILSDTDSPRPQSRSLINRDLLARIVKALKPGGRLRSLDGSFARTEGVERAEAILAGLMVEGNDGMVKPNYDATQSVPLRFGKKKSEGAATALTSAAGTGAVTLNLNGKRKTGPPDTTQPTGVGFVDFSDDFDAPVEEEDDDELIDEDTLLDEEDLARPIIQRTFPRGSLCVFLTDTVLQRLSVVPKPASVVVPAKTVPVVSPRKWKRKTPPSAPTQMPLCPLSAPLRS